MRDNLTMKNTPAQNPKIVVTTERGEQLDEKTAIAWIKYFRENIEVLKHQNEVLSARVDTLNLVASIVPMRSLYVPGPHTNSISPGPTALQ